MYGTPSDWILYISKCAYAPSKCCTSCHGQFLHHFSIDCITYVHVHGEGAPHHSREARPRRTLERELNVVLLKLLSMAPSNVQLDMLISINVRPFEFAVHYFERVEIINCSCFIALTQHVNSTYLNISLVLYTL